MTETRASLREPLLAFAIATALAAAFAALGMVVPLVREYLHVLTAAFSTWVMSLARMHSATLAASEASTVVAENFPPAP